MSLLKKVIRVIECGQRTCSLKDDAVPPIDFELQEGGKRENPDELTQKSDSGD
ncbi:hypothetical protein SJI19_00475 [Acerihabitans sp. TG2]|uniref:hypothetical protein n=1 Tax=Acerihabitans sp. TG2 TaxID=3096008 RepID=UPI002B23BF2D|nr:hypothetical protein [Acerihabitans sp. TG2]MEA9389044.1 hypothetical protein [Acerihabitans sp. TG2]